MPLSLMISNMYVHHMLGSNFGAIAPLEIHAPWRYFRQKKKASICSPIFLLFQKLLVFRDENREIHD